MSASHTWLSGTLLASVQNVRSNEDDGPYGFRYPECYVGALFTEPSHSYDAFMSYDFRIRKGGFIALLDEWMRLDLQFLRSVWLVCFEL
jgi:hypothetical protein